MYHHAILGPLLLSTVLFGLYYAISQLENEIVHISVECCCKELNSQLLSKWTRLHFSKWVFGSSNGDNGWGSAYSK